MIQCHLDSNNWMSEFECVCEKKINKWNFNTQRKVQTKMMTQSHE